MKIKLKEMRKSINEESALVSKINKKDVIAFLKKYPKIKQIMTTLVKKNAGLMKGYLAFLKFKDKEEPNLGGRGEEVDSPSFGTKTFYKYDWGKLTGWAEVYQYLYLSEYGKISGAKAQPQIVENASIEAISIAQYTGTRKDAVQSFIDTHKLNAKKLLSYVAKGKLKDRMDFVSAISGKAGNPMQKKIIKMFEVTNTSYRKYVNENESLTEVDYKTAVSQFNAELEKHPDVVKAAKHYGKTPAEIVKALQMRLSTKGDRNKNTKEVSIDFKDTDSGVKISHKKKFDEGVAKSTSLNEVTVTRIPNFNLESDAYIFMLYLLKNNSGFKKAATNAGIDLFSGANTKSVFTSLQNNLKKVITPQIVKAVVEKINEKRTVIFIDDTDIQKGVHTARFAGLLALGVVDSFINDPIDYKLIKDLGNAKLKGLADEFSVGRGKIKLGAMLGNKGF
jgi:hypothetical protein